MKPWIKDVLDGAKMIAATIAIVLFTIGCVGVIALYSKV